ncbi:MAG: cellulase family glycosylhydrolase [Bacteroidota bacterium]|nr:cellulase family glycosylhydrolase [Bacteroidota bacterium]MDP4216774.1 cellulase family glycosylhydrolase [Bacteroidota bacterium]MDP4246976.1 cellulase family glycosylhydrolase [Bacteroidota bacterium]MDP4252646.1 cellulase family glycosylhydrolase [Bacteroidota bacterium]MDP4258511.1 cellulase family glycosylhydrolase [Bacteroidota bacterium]
MHRRVFIKRTGLITVGLSLAETAVLARPATVSNKLPKWKGFNVLDFFSPDPAPSRRPTTREHFAWMRDWGFDFIRIPIAYPHYLKFDRSRDINPDEVYQVDESRIEEIAALVGLAHQAGMHVSLNLHRAPGYCINAGFHEPYNLWTDQRAQDAFYWHWSLWAKRFKHTSPKKISFDLLNEPSMREDMNDQHSRQTPVPGELYRKVAKAAAEAIRKENSEHLVIADGNNVGSSVIPEIMDLNIAQSCRGYYPHAISHYKAPWANKDPDHLPEPKWPGQVGAQYLSRSMLEVYYKPWIDAVQKGIGVHCGECGCWNKTPHDVFMAWFRDVLDILSAGQIGFAIWNFIGDFGVLDSGRADVVYEDWHGHKLDRAFLDLLRAH